MIEYDIRSGQSVISLITAEEGRAELEIYKIAAEMKRPITTWSCTEGLRCGEESEAMEDPLEALNAIRSKPRGNIFIFRDLHMFWDGGMAGPIVRNIRDIARDFKQQKKTLILLSPVNKLPPELTRDVVVIEFDLPGEDMLNVVFQKIHASAKGKFQIEEDEKDKIINAMKGLTTTEAENALAKSMIIKMRDANHKDSHLSELVLKEKALAVKKSGVLEYFESEEDASSIGGLDNLKKWLNIRSAVFSKKAREFGLPRPKGILLAGMPGCGKSLTAKAASNIFKVPLIKFDIGRLMGGIVGQTESNTRNALQTIDAIDNCVVFIDELEKAFAGMGGDGSTDSGVSKRMFGSIITWMQEKKSSAFIIGTVNNIDVLPAELLRKGRFDEIFFVNLPNAQERHEILNISCKKYKRDPSKFDFSNCVKDSEGYSGAELSEAVVSGLFTAFHRNEDLHVDFVHNAILNTNPLSKSKSDQLESMKKWAQRNAVSASKTDKSEKPCGRILDF